jgi:hypothetical protein
MEEINRLFSTVRTKTREARKNKMYYGAELPKQVRLDIYGGIIRPDVLYSVRKGGNQMKVVPENSFLTPEELAVLNMVQCKFKMTVLKLLIPIEILIIVAYLYVFGSSSSHMTMKLISIIFIALMGYELSNRINNHGTLKRKFKAIAEDLGERLYQNQKNEDKQ